MPRYSRDNPLGLPIEPTLITEQRQCRKCGYALTGLRIGGKCPECGTVITGRKIHRNDSHIDEAPKWYLRCVSLGALLTFITAPLGLAGIGALLLMDYTSPGFHTIVKAMLVVSLGWWAGVVLVTFARPGATIVIPGNPEPKPADVKLRFACRATQLLWSIGITLTLINAYVFVPIGAASGVVSFASGICQFIALLTTVLYTTYCAILCDWAGDDETANRLRLSPISALAGILLPGSFLIACLNVVIGQGGVGVFTSGGLILASGAFCFFMFGLLRGLFTFSSLFGWAIKNQNLSAEIDARASDRIQQRMNENTFQEKG